MEWDEALARWYPRIGLVLALVLGFTAQYLFTGELFTHFQDSNTWDWQPNFTAGTVLLVLAVGCAGWALWRARVDPSGEATRTDYKVNEPLLNDWNWLIVAAICYGCSLLLYMFTKEVETLWVDGLWLAAIGLTVVPLWRRSSRSLTVERIRWWEWGLVISLTLVGFGLRYWNLLEIPSRVDNDIALMGTFALNLIQKSQYGWIGSSQSGHLLSYDQSIAWGMRLFGANQYGLAMRSVLAGTLTLPALFLLGRELFNCRVGLIAMALLTISYTHIHFSRTLFGPATTLVAVLAFYFLARGIRSGQTLWFAIAGLATGLGILMYDSGRVIPVVVLGVAGWQFLWRRAAFHAQLKNWTVLAIAVIIAFGPMLGLVFKDFSAFVGRGNTVALWTPDVWQHEEDAYHATGAADVVIQQVLHTFLTLHLYGDGSPHFSFPRPMVDPLTAALCILGVAVCTLSGRQLNCFIPIAWVVFTFILGGVITYDPPYWPHLNIALPAIFLVAGCGADQLITAVSPQQGNVGYGAVRVALIGLIAITGVYNWQAYYDYVKDNGGDRILAVRYLNGLPLGYQVFMISQQISWNEFDFRFFNQGVPGRDLTIEQLRADPPILNGPMVFLVYRQPDVVQMLRYLYPNGDILEHRNNENRVLFTSYKVAPAGYVLSKPGESFNPLSRPGWWLIFCLLGLLASRSVYSVWHRNRIQPVPDSMEAGQEY